MCFSLRQKSVNVKVLARLVEVEVARMKYRRRTIAAILKNPVQFCFLVSFACSSAYQSNLSCRM